jgi:hypothetical protein
MQRRRRRQLGLWKQRRTGQTTQPRQFSARCAQRRGWFLPRNSPTAQSPLRKQVNAGNTKTRARARWAGECWQVNAGKSAAAAAYRDTHTHTPPHLVLSCNAGRQSQLVDADTGWLGDDPQQLVQLCAPDGHTAGPWHLCRACGAHHSLQQRQHLGRIRAAGGSRDDVGV